MTATLEDRLADAISEGQEQVALQLLERHPDLEVNALGEQRNTLLHLACQRNHPGIVRRLLAHPAIDPNTPSRKTFTSPLVTAAYWGRLESVQVLLQDPRVDVNRAEFDGRTALWWASCFNYPGIIRWLMALRGRELDVGTSVTCGAAKYNPLDVAINRNAECAVKLLQDFAADLPGTIARLRRELRVAELQAAEYFAVVVLLADDLYLLPSPLLSPPESIHPLPDDGEDSAVGAPDASLQQGRRVVARHDPHLRNRAFLPPLRPHLLEPLLSSSPILRKR